MPRLHGMYPALITPFTAEGTIDEDALRRLVAYHVDKGSDGLFLCGSLGSGPGMSAEERRRVVEVAIEAAGGRLRTIVHVGTINPGEATDLARHAEEAGADAVAAVAPYYYRPAWPVVRAFYDRLLDVTGLPVWAYNQPAHSHFEFTADQVLELSERGVRGYKDGGLSYYAFQQVLLRANREQLTVFTAVPSLLFAALVDGADGFIGGPNNVLPQFYNALYAAVRDGDWGRAVALERRAGEVFRLCGGPGAVSMWHALLAEFGVASGQTRLPQPPITEEVRAMAAANAARLRQIIEELGIAW
ncbi:MAG: dihydrodipicolinate synthase family protein [Armatimonadota bacterium]|nr:dihydrodipicolinate synthase family protein [Armatimonadota bacterium]MDR7427251.1 dihydrodipicolinate synthase family protein [Armatimonadota bacterium]MDR7463175.1 dihydrodipicolinate synthase family protein [Armatimonadota bacterium]MDR7475420.1 dihydrodipicolinate synthase family protein [Armatimonadota bacterium]MDR7540177.1 dihydrodipicolinate synthase family protein [Armatimonadota bacterium]